MDLCLSTVGQACTLISSGAATFGTSLPCSTSVVIHVAALSANPRVTQCGTFLLDLILAYLLLVCCSLLPPRHTPANRACARARSCAHTHFALLTVSTTNLPQSLVSKVVNIRSLIHQPRSFLSIQLPPESNSNTTLTICRDPRHCASTSIPPRRFRPAPTYSVL